MDRSPGLRERPDNVSILVFVELALDGHDKHLVELLVEHVSILVFVELALDEGSCDLCRVSDCLFQSLFSWNLLLMNPSLS